MPADDEKTERSLVAHSAQQLSIRAAIVKRGLQEVIRHRTPTVAWSRPGLVGTISCPSESLDQRSPENKLIFFNCLLENMSDTPQTLSGDVGVLRRSRATGEITSPSRDGFGFPASSIVVPPATLSPPILLGLSFPKEKSLEQCLEDLFQESCELLAYDAKFGTVIVIGLDQPSLVGLPASHDKKKERILEVDDEEPIRKIIRDMLTSAGYACTSVPNGVDALALLESGEKFDLLLNDLLNTPMDGIQLLEKVHSEFPELPVVMVTAVHDIDVALAALRLGASDYLLKPFYREQLLVFVRQVLACRKHPTWIAHWEQGLTSLIEPALEGQLVVRTMDGTPKLIRDLAPGDIVRVKSENGVHMLHLGERDGKLAAIDFGPNEKNDPS